MKPFWLAAIFCGLLLSTQACTYSTSWHRSNEAGVAASQQGHYAEAEKYYLAALKEAESSFAPEDPRLAAFVAVSTTWRSSTTPKASTPKPNHSGNAP